MLTLCGVACFLVTDDQRDIVFLDEIPLRSTGHIEPQTTFDLSGSWELRWDDSFDGELEASFKRCTVNLNQAQGRVTGDFTELDSSNSRRAILTGQVNEGSTTLFTFEQREGDYTCVYQIGFNPTVGGEQIGTWQDTLGRSGSFSLVKYQ